MLNKVLEQQGASFEHLPLAFPKRLRLRKPKPALREAPDVVSGVAMTAERAKEREHARRRADLGVREPVVTETMRAQERPGTLENAMEAYDLAHFKRATNGRPIGDPVADEARAAFKQKVVGMLEPGTDTVRPGYHEGLKATFQKAKAEGRGPTAEDVEQGFTGPSGQEVAQGLGQAALEGPGLIARTAGHSLAEAAVGQFAEPGSPLGHLKEGAGDLAGYLTPAGGSAFVADMAKAVAEGKAGEALQGLNPVHIYQTIVDPEADWGQKAVAIGNAALLLYAGVHGVRSGKALLERLKSDHPEIAPVVEEGIRNGSLNKAFDLSGMTEPEPIVPVGQGGKPRPRLRLRDTARKPAGVESERGDLGQEAGRGEPEGPGSQRQLAGPSVGGVLQGEPAPLPDALDAAKAQGKAPTKPVEPPDVRGVNVMGKDEKPKPVDQWSADELDAVADHLRKRAAENDRPLGPGEARIVDGDFLRGEAAKAEAYREAKFGPRNAAEPPVAPSPPLEPAVAPEAPQTGQKEPWLMTREEAKANWRDIEREADGVFNDRSYGGNIQKVIAFMRAMKDEPYDSGGNLRGVVLGSVKAMPGGGFRPGSMYEELLNHVEAGRIKPQDAAELLRASNSKDWGGIDVNKAADDLLAEYERLIGPVNAVPQASEAVLKDYPDLAEKANASPVRSDRTPNDVQGDVGGRGPDARGEDLQQPPPGRSDGGPRGQAQEAPPQEGLRPEEAQAHDARNADDVTGLANQVQARESEAGVLSEVEATKGKSPEEWQRIGKEKVDSGSPEGDYEGLARRVADGEEELTGEKVGVLLEGKRRLLQEVNNAKADLDAHPGDKGATERLRAAQERLDGYVQDVQAGKGRWSDVGRALQAGTQLDTGDFAEVVQAARRTGRSSARLEAELEKMSAEIAANRKRIAELEANPNVLQAERSLPRARRFDKAGAKARIKANVQRLKTLQGSQGVGGGKTRGAASKITAEDIAVLKEQALIVRDIAMDAARVVGGTLEDVILHVQQALAKEGIDIDRDAVVDALAMSERNAREQTPAASVRAEARQEATARARQTELKGQLRTGLRIARRRPKTASQVVEDIRAQNKVLDARVKAKIKERESHPAVRFLRGTSETVRGTILGGDLGMMFRQGLFVNPVARPRTWFRSFKAANKNIFSETNLAKWAEAQETKRYSDGTLALKARKDAGLSTTDVLNSHEELVFPRLLQKVPVVGKAIGGAAERWQTTFINTARTEMFDAVYEKGVRGDGLRARARFVNNVTGRGNFKNAPGDIAEIVMTSPRYERSRWGTLGELLRNPAEALTNAGSRQNLIDIGATVGTLYGVSKMAELAGYRTSWDPDSPDFLKMRRYKTVKLPNGKSVEQATNEVWDISAGLAPRVRDVARAVMYWRSPDYGKTLTDVIGRGTVRTISPAVRTPATEASMAYQRATGKRKPLDPFSGYKREEGEAEGWKAFLPLIAQGFLQAQGEGSSPAGVAAKEFVGTGVNFYPKPRKKSGSGLRLRSSSRSRLR